jgi:hypothetical protein
MALAYRHFLYPPRHIDWQFATARQQKVGLGGDWAAVAARRKQR